MRILLISQDFPPDVGGTQTYALELARHLTMYCDDFAVIAPEQPADASVDAQLPFDVLRVPATKNAISLKALPAVLRLVRTRSFDAAFHVQWPSVLVSRMIKPMGGPRRIFVAAHGRELLLEPLSGVPGKLYDRIRRNLLRRADGVFAVSRYTRSLLYELGVRPERIAVLHNGTDPTRFSPLDVSDIRRTHGLDGRKVLLTVGRLVPRKGIDTVLRALPGVAREMPDALYVICGEGPDRERLETLARDLQVADRTRFLGEVAYEDLPRYYNACDVFVMPSRQVRPFVEGFGIVFLEANACGKAVVGANSGGIPDAVRDGETGLLVEPDNETELAEALLRLLRDPDLATRLGQNGRRRVVEEATWEHTARRLYEHIARCM